MKSHVKHAKHFWPGGDKSAHGGHSTFFGWGAGIDVGPPSILSCHYRGPRRTLTNQQLMSKPNVDPAISDSFSLIVITFWFVIKSSIIHGEVSSSTYIMIQYLK